MAFQVLRCGAKVARNVLSISERAALLSGRGAGIAPFTNIRRNLSSVTTFSEKTRLQESDYIKIFSAALAIPVAGYMLVNTKAEAAEVSSTTDNHKESNAVYIRVINDRVIVDGKTKLLGNNVITFYSGATTITIQNGRGNQWQMVGNGNFTFHGVDRYCTLYITTNKPVYYMN